MSPLATGLLLVVLCAILEGCAQTSLKQSTLAADRKRLWIAVALSIFAFEALVYTGALQFLEVSTAYPLGSLNDVVVAVLSRCLLGEAVTKTRWIGVALILAGASLLVVQA
jgi:multidrug transporter EmrE-like cation transporter